MSSIPEKRFKEGSGERLLENGKVRCHALSKTRIREWRELNNDYATPSEDLWPECQCGVVASDGQYVCRFHGGKTPRTKSPPRTILDVLPFDLAEKYKQIVQHPNYISRKEDILLIKARQWELLEELQSKAGSDEAWATVHEALVKLKRGDEISAIELIQDALKITEQKQDIWNELYRVEKLLGDLTSTQMKTAKELRIMATAEQVNSLINTLLHILISSVDDYILDPVLSSQYKQKVVNEIQRLTNTHPGEMLTIDSSITER